jgi:LasA protease
MDARFSGFDTIAHVRRTQPALADRAEAISHWAGYYSVNPLLLARVVHGRAAADARAVEALARALAVAAASSEVREPAAAGADAQPDRALEQMLALPAAAVDALLAATQADMTAAGLWGLQVVIADAPPALDLPFAPPRAWQFNGVHTWTGSDDGSPMSSLDFTSSWSQDWGDDTSGETVTAAHDGEATVLSSCFVQVQHPGGWGTRYYHLDGVSLTTGAQLRAGDPIGVYANQEARALCSGGHSTGPHLHFALLRDGQYASLEDVALSGYAIHPGDLSYDTHPDRMWLEKRGQRYYAFGPAIAKEPGDNTVDYRYNGMWYAPGHDGHGLNIEIGETPAGGGARKTIFVAMYTYDDAGAANFYAGNRDYDRWRTDESLAVDLLQTAGGDLTDLLPIDFGDPGQVAPAGSKSVFSTATGPSSTCCSTSGLRASRWRTRSSWSG